jgi:hypothetical protein
MYHNSRPTTINQTNSIVNTPLVNKSNLLLNFGPIHTSAVVDTGATCSIISQSVFEKIKSQKGVIITPPQPINLSAKTANSQTLNFQFKVKIHFKIQYLSWSFNFLVAENLAVDVILGTDFLEYTKAIINIAKATITFPYPQPLILSFELNEPSKSDGMNNKTPTYGANLSPNQIQSIKKVLDQFPDTITKKLGRTNLLEYHINIKEGHKVRCRPYQFAPPKTEIIRRHIQELLDNGVIRESNSHFASPAFTVPKKGGATRLVINYRELNKGLILEATPMPQVQSCFQHLGKAKWFTLLDLNSAYNQIPLDEQSKKYTAFVVPWGQFEYNYVPFGLANGSMVLTDLINKIFGDIKFKYLYTFFDDIVIYSDTFEEHINHVKEVLLRLKQANLTVNPSKITVASNKIEFLGHVIQNNTLSVSREKTQPIDDFPTPKNVKQLARFLGMTAYYSSFIKNYSEISAPLNYLKKKGIPFKWGPEQQTAFEKLKRALTSAPILKMPDFDLPWILQTDASRTSIGAVLAQRHNGVLLPVAYASRPTNKHERNYSAFELEALAVTFFLNKFRVYLEHRHFELHTDNSALTWLLNHPRQVGKIARWITLINAFQFSVYHISGKDNPIADALSRLYEEQNPKDANSQAPTNISHTNHDTPQTNSVNLLSKIPDVFKDLKSHQQQDPHIAEIIKSLSKPNPPSGYFLQQGILMHVSPNQTKPRIVVPDNIINLLFQYYHQAPTTAHLGMSKTWARIEPNFWADQLKLKISDLVRSCDVCQRSKQAPNTRQGHLSSEIASRPFEKVFIDYIGPLPRSTTGNKYILTVIDSFSKYTVLLAARNTNAKTTVNLLKKGLFSYFGFPKYLVSDNASSFRSKEFSEMCLEFGISHITTTPYYPNPSHAERANKNIKVAIRIYHSQNQTQWDQNLHFFQIAFNSAQNRSTGFAPADLFLTFTLSHPLELQWNLDELLPQNRVQQDTSKKWSQAISNLTKARAQRQKQYNAGRIPNQYKVGDWVMYRLHHQSKAVQHINAKLLPVWSKPLVIETFTSPVTVNLTDPTTGKHVTRAHISQLKKYFLPKY